MISLIAKLRSEAAATLTSAAWTGRAAKPHKTHRKNRILSTDGADSSTVFTDFPVFCSPDAVLWVYPPGFAVKSYTLDCVTRLPMPSWKEKLADSMDPQIAEEIDVFEMQMALRRT